MIRYKRWQLRLDSAMLLVTLISLTLVICLQARESRHLRSELARARTRADWVEAHARWSRLGPRGTGVDWEDSMNYRYWAEKVHAAGAGGAGGSGR